MVGLNKCDFSERELISFNQKSLTINRKLKINQYAEG